MADSIPRATVSTSAVASVRQRPALLLMVVRVRAAEATLELGLAGVKRACEDAVRRLTRLGAAKVWAGDPHPDDQANPDPMARMRVAAAATARRMAPAGPPDRHGVNVALAALWELAGRSPEEVLTLVDRLRFEIAADAEPPDQPAGPTPWAEPEEQIQQLQRLVAQAINPPDDCAPQFLYIARPTEEQLARAAAEAYELARQQAERLARVAGRRLGGPTALNYGHTAADGRADRLMEQQRCAAVLASISYELRDGEAVSEDARATEVTISVHASYALE